MKYAHSFSELMQQILVRKGPFLGVFFIVMMLSYGVLYAIDFIPEPISDSEEDSAAEAQNIEPVRSTTTEDTDESGDKAPFPVSIHIDALDRTVDVLNPQSSSVERLDAALLEGAVRHPESADFEDPGNIFILAHSSYLPNVLNSNFQAFNGIQKLTWGDIVRLRSADTEYIYRVERVYEAAASEVTVPNSRGEAKLTLATCNTFGAKEDRFIVEASLVSTKTL